MGLIKDELGLEVEESILKKVQDPAFQETSAVLDYWSRRKAKEQEESDKQKKQEEEEKQEKQKLFGLF